MPNKDFQNASSNFTLFLPTPNPQKHENPSRLKDFRGGSAAGARPRVAKAMLSCHHYTARHRRILRADAPRRLRRISRPSISSQCGLESFWMGTCFRNIFLMFFEKSSWNRNFVGNRRLFWGASEFPKAPAKGFSRRTAANFNLLLRVKAPLCKRLLCVKAFVCKSFCVQKPLCVKTSLCKSFCV